ncbi:hypothetical protein ACK25U_19885 [Ectopseudomonas mendocina]
MLKLGLMAFASTLLGVAAYYFGVKFSYSDFKDYSNTLLAISGMVFTIMGIWIAFVYPNAIRRLQDPGKIKIADFSSTMQDTRRLESIVGSIMESGFVAMCIALTYLIKLIISGLPIYEAGYYAIKSTALGLIVFLTLIQSSAVFSVIYANYLFLSDLHSKREVQEINNDITG